MKKIDKKDTLLATFCRAVFPCFCYALFFHPRKMFRVQVAWNRLLERKTFLIRFQRSYCVIRLLLPIKLRRYIISKFFRALRWKNGGPFA